MDIKELIKWSLKRWWWFVISVGACMLIGGIYYVTCTPKYNVRATLMLRQATNGKSGQDEMMQMMGFGGSKVATDEIQILTSRDLMGRVVDELGLSVSYFQKTGSKWEEIFPTNEIKISCSNPIDQPFTLDIFPHKEGYTLKLKQGRFNKEKYHVSTLSQPVPTSVGNLSIKLPVSSPKTHYRAIMIPKIVRVSSLLEEISVTRLSRESNIIVLSCLSSCPARSIATINTLLQFYNQESTTDKNLLAIQTEQFLDNRIAIVERELNDAETAMENYKRSQQISDLDVTANTYQQLSNDYEQKVAELNADVVVLDFITEQVAKSEKENSMIAGNMSKDYENLNLLIQDYNEHVAHMNELLQAATEENLMVIKEKQLISRKRVAIHDGVTQARQAHDLRRQAVLKQQNEYASRLAAIPETERIYMEMSRDKKTKEKQYLYLIEKREENAMLLASKAVPSKIVEQAQQNPKPAQPQLSVVGLVALLLGLALPFLVYFFDLFRKEYL